MSRHISSVQPNMMVSISTLEKIAQQLKALSSIDVIVHELSIDGIRVRVQRIDDAQHNAQYYVTGIYSHVQKLDVPVPRSV